MNKTLLQKEHIKIAIIGAGIAGLSAAYSLYEMGFTQIVILEAQEKVGGRVLSLSSDEYILELGAQWIHGTDNPLYNFSSLQNLLCNPDDEPSHEGEGLFCTPDGYVIQISIVNEMRSMLDEMKIKLTKGQYDSSFVSKSVQQFFSEYFDTYIANHYNDSLNPIRKGLFDWFLKFEIIDNACNDLDEVALQCYSEWCDVPDDVYHLNFEKGFSSVIDVMLSKIPAECLYLKKPVKSINWQRFFNSKNIDKFFNQSSDSDIGHQTFPVLLECENGEDVHADVVILTASVGFIKENMNTFFRPSLPENKAKAFSEIGFGTINKIFLIYDKPFWNAHELGFQLIWTGNLDKECKKLLKENPWIKGITGFDIVRKQHNILLGWIGGIEAKLIEKVNIETISSVCTNLLRKFLKRPDISYPVKTLRSCWYNNNYVKGAYSYRSVKFYDSNLTSEDLQYPLYSTYVTKSGETKQLPVVVFAGEAIDETSFSSAHGAYQSGLKAANDINIMCSEILIRKHEISWQSGPDRYNLLFKYYILNFSENTEGLPIVQ